MNDIETSGLLVKIFLALTIIPSPLAILPVVHNIWSFQERFLSIRTPRNYVFSHLLNMFSIYSEINLTTHTTLIARYHTVFFILSENLLTFNHFDTNVSPWFMTRDWIFLEPINILVPSANTIEIVCHIQGTSQRYKWKKKEWSKNEPLWYITYD